jgi:chromate transporter
VVVGVSEISILDIIAIMILHFSTADWLVLFTHFLSLSLLAIGGAITTAPDMHHYLVLEKSWLTEGQFTSSIALAQAAPGPNLLFIAVLGWNVGLNAGGGIAAGTQAWIPALAGVVIAMVGILLPSTTLTFAAARWGHNNRERRIVRAFKQGMSPIVIALLVATGWILAGSQGGGDITQTWWLWLITFATIVLMRTTTIHMMWLLAGGAVLGAVVHSAA